MRFLGLRLYVFSPGVTNSEDPETLPAFGDLRQLL